MDPKTADQGVSRDARMAVPVAPVRSPPLPMDYADPLRARADALAGVSRGTGSTLLVCGFAAIVTAVGASVVPWEILRFTLFTTAVFTAGVAVLGGLTLGILFTEADDSQTARRGWLSLVAGLLAVGTMTLRLFL